MKPRYSMAAMLGLTAYLALACAAFARPATIWTMIHYYAWFGIVFWWSIDGACLRPQKSVFAIAAVFGTISYAIATTFHPQASERNGWYWPLHLRLPHQFLADFAQRNGELNNSELEALDRWALQSVSLFIGLLCGSIAVWRRQTLVRRELHCSSHP